MPRQQRFNWLAGLQGRLARRRRRDRVGSNLAARRRALRSEPLEDRRLLAITVDTLVDEADGSIVDGDISLRDALAVVGPGTTIDFAESIHGGTIELVLGELLVDQAITIPRPRR